MKTDTETTIGGSLSLVFSILVYFCFVLYRETPAFQHVECVCVCRIC